MPPNYVALSFGSWGPTLTRLSVNLRRLFVPFGRESGASYEGRLPDKLDDGPNQDDVVPIGCPSS